MKFLTYEEVIIGMMSDNNITMRQALADDWYGVKNVKKYLSAFKVAEPQINLYLNIFMGHEPDKTLSK